MFKKLMKTGTAALATAATLLGMLALAPAASAAPDPANLPASTSPQNLYNPIVPSTYNEGTADPSMVYSGGYYYYLKVYDDTKLELFRSPNLATIAEGTSKILWTAGSDSGTKPGSVWAPELSYSKKTGRWYAYFTVIPQSGGEHRMYVLEGGSSLDQDFTFKGQLANQTGPNVNIDRLDGTTAPGVEQIDGSLFEVPDPSDPTNPAKNQLYFVDSIFDNDSGAPPQYIQLFKMLDPLTIDPDSPSINISKPDQSWETHGSPIQEGPEVLQHDGKTFVFYSASFSGTQYYQLGYVSIDSNKIADMKASDWVKSSTSWYEQGNGQYGPGHNSFIEKYDADGNVTSTTMVYHESPLVKDNGWITRQVSQEMVPLTWDANNQPVFEGKDKDANGAFTPGPLGTPVATANVQYSDPLTSWTTDDSDAAFNSQHTLGTTTDATYNSGPTNPMTGQPTQWHTYGDGTWAEAADGTGLVGTDLGGAAGDKAMLSDLNLRNFTVSVDVKVLSVGGSNEGPTILFRNSLPTDGGDQQTGYYFGINAAAGEAEQGQQNDTWFGAHASTKPIDFQMGQTYNLKVVANGDYINEYIDGKLQFSFIDPYYSQGTVGLRVRGSSAQFSNLTITTNDLTPEAFANPIDPKQAYQIKLSSSKNSSGMVVSPQGMAADDGTAVVNAANQNVNAQAWTFIPVTDDYGNPNGTYKIANLASNKLITVPGSTAADGGSSKLVLESDSNQDGQLWVLQQSTDGNLEFAAKCQMGNHGQRNSIIELSNGSFNTADQPFDTWQDTLQEGSLFELVPFNSDAVDKTYLQSLVDQYASLDQHAFTADSWAAYQSALDKALAVLADSSVSQVDVNTAAQALVAARNGLVTTTEVKPIPGQAADSLLWQADFSKDSNASSDPEWKQAQAISNNGAYTGPWNYDATTGLSVAGGYSQKTVETTASFGPGSSTADTAKGYVVDADITITAQDTSENQSQGGIIFNVDPNSLQDKSFDGYAGYYVGLNVALQQVILGKSNTTAPTWTQLAIKQLPLSYGKTYHLAVAVNQGEIIVYVDYDGSRYPLIDAYDSQFSSGVVGARNFNAKYSVQNMKVSAYDPTQAKNYASGQVSDVDNQPVVYDKDGKVETYTDPLVSMAADPDILYYQGTYYLYPTNAGDANDDNGLKAYTSTDMVHWTDQGFVLQADDVLHGGGGQQNNFWAPGIVERDDPATGQPKFYLYYVSAEHIGLATADSPLGPFKNTDQQYLNLSDNQDIDSDAQATSQTAAFSYTKAIDPYVFKDDDGSYYIYFDRFTGGNVIWGAKLNDDMKTIDVSSLKQLAAPSASWEGTVNEGAAIIHKSKADGGDGLYYMLYSGNVFTSGGYGVGYAVGTTPLGPFTKYGSNPILQAQSYSKGSGHCSVIPSPDGKEMFLVYHRFNDSAGSGTTEPRRTGIDRIHFETDLTGNKVLAVAGPTVTAQPIPSGATDVDNLIATNIPTTATVAHGTPVSQMVTGGTLISSKETLNTQRSATVKWDTPKDYDPTKVTQQVIHLTGTVVLPSDMANLGGVSLKVSATVTVLAAGLVPVYRLYNKNTGEHFYTTSAGERNVNVKKGWRDEGTLETAPATGKPVYRVYNPNARGGDHYYTLSLGEARSLVAKGWRWDNNQKPVFYSGGQVKVLVAYNPNARSGAHNYTTSQAEQDSLLKRGWKYGATAWYAAKAR